MARRLKFGTPSLRTQDLHQYGKLGLDTKLEREVHAAFPEAANILVVHRVLPGLSSYGRIEEGDIVVRVGKDVVVPFTIYYTQPSSPESIITINHCQYACKVVVNISINPNRPTAPLHGKSTRAYTG